MVTNKRRKYLIKRAFQLKYIGIILFFILITAALSSVGVYLAIFPFLYEKLANVYPQGRLVAVLKDANAKLFFSTVLLLPVAAWFGIILSHRVAGPWYRLENILRAIGEGSLIHEVKLRRGDELQSLAEAINGVIRNLESVNRKNQSCLKSLDEAFRDFEVELNREPVDLMKTKLLLSKMQDISYELKSLQR